MALTSADSSDSARPKFEVPLEPPKLQLPDFSTQEWRYVDSLPEIKPSYDDARWTLCDHTTTTQPQLNLSTPTSLYASDYGYHTGSLLYRVHFTANGAESTLFLNVSGGYAFAHSVWLNEQFLGSWVGSNSNQTFAQTFNLPAGALKTGDDGVFTVLIDHMGQTEAGPGNEQIKFPLGLLDYDLTGRDKTDVTWRMTGNLGGEDYRDLTRGPRNEGAMFAERQGFHLPAPASDEWRPLSPIADGVSAAGVGFFSTSFNLSIPEGYDVPLSFVFTDGIASGSNFRVQLFVNGYQYGKVGSLVAVRSA